MGALSFVTAPDSEVLPKGPISAVRFSPTNFVAVGGQFHHSIALFKLSSMDPNHPHLEHVRNLPLATSADVFSFVLRHQPAEHLYLVAGGGKCVSFYDIDADGRTTATSEFSTLRTDIPPTAPLLPLR